MKTVLKASLLAITLAFGSAHAADAKPATPAAGTPGIVMGDAVKAEAEVVAIDKKTRTVTLKGEDGNVFDELSLRGCVAALDGSDVIRASGIGTPGRARELGLSVAGELFELGARELLGH